MKTVFLGVPHTREQFQEDRLRTVSPTRIYLPLRLVLPSVWDLAAGGVEMSAHILYSSDNCNRKHRINVIPNVRHREGLVRHMPILDFQIQRIFRFWYGTGGWD